jgi:hypothetical protein
VNGIKGSFVDQFDTSSLYNVSIYNDQEDKSSRVTGSPYYLFDALKPDFGIIEQAGYQVLDWYLYKRGADSGSDRRKRMDVFGRLIAKFF